MSFGTRDLAVSLLPPCPGASGCAAGTNRCHPPSACPGPTGPCPTPSGCPGPSLCQPPSECPAESAAHFTWCTTTREEDKRSRQAGLDLLRRQLRALLENPGVLL